MIIAVLAAIGIGVAIAEDAWALAVLCLAVCALVVE